MNKEEYLSYRRNGNDLMILYKHYVQCFNEKKHSPFLNVNDFARTIQMWEGFIFLDVKIKQLYDEFFNIVILYTKEGQFLAFI